MLTKLSVPVFILASALSAQPGQPAPVQQSLSMRDPSLKVQVPAALQGVGIEQKLDQQIPLTLTFR
ncbi:MAG: hypothetical protein JO323_03260, partial [Acidobacteriia bacterium]|nr:hypothetical protein [Terriglobia bacterium]